MDRTSYMLAVPADESELEDPKLLVDRVSEMDGVDLTSAKLEDEAVAFELIYNDTLYQAKVYPMEFELPEFFRAQHRFSEVDIAAIEERETGLAVELLFEEDALASYHLQLKLIDAMLSCGVLAVIDDNAENILSGRWMSLAASSHVPPAPRYLFTVQAVSEGGEDGADEVWLHTHGLNRCGVTELEVLGSDRENYDTHYHVIETMAKRLLELDEPLEPKDPLMLARISADVILVTTLLTWKDAIHFYEDGLGGSADREEGHNGETSCIFAYASEEDYEQERMSPISIYDDLLSENPLYMISERETARMKALALERIAYVKRMISEEDVHILVKLGLPVDDEENEDQSQREHIWFELKEISDLTLIGELTQEPYYIDGLHKGHIGEYPIDMITDWIIYTSKRSITPDDVYLLEECNYSEQRFAYTAKRVRT